MAVGAIGYIHFVLPEKGYINAKVLFYAVLLSQVYDVAWLSVYLKVCSN
jgi:hypothetical protein